MLNDLISGFPILAVRGHDIPGTDAFRSRLSITIHGDTKYGSAAACDKIRRILKGRKLELIWPRRPPFYS